MMTPLLSLFGQEKKARVTKLIFLCSRSSKVSANVLGFAMMGNQNSISPSIAQKFIRITNAQLSNSVPLLQNPF